MNHAVRAHATWSASATLRNVTCPGALAFTALFPNKPSVHAAKGTAAHELGERCLKDSRKSPFDFLGQEIKADDLTFEVDEEMANAVSTYVEFVRAEAERMEASHSWLEQFFSLESLNPPFDAGGTCDVVLLSERQKAIHVIDYKNGTHGVEARGNPQVRTYALGALIAVNKPGITHVTSTIVQPRAWHAAGAIRSETIHVVDLMDWGGELLNCMAKAKEAHDAFNALPGDRPAFEAWAAKYLVPGACDFCPALGDCPSARGAAMKVAPEEIAAFIEKPGLPAPAAPTLPMPTTPDDLGRVLDGLELLEDWIKAVRHHAHTLAEAGIHIPGWELVEKIGLRKWLDEEQAAQGLRDLDVPEEKIWTRKIVSPAQADKLLGKNKEKIASLYHKPVTGLNLVQEKKTSRQPVDVAGFVE
jgi:hypothetical protein